MRIADTGILGILCYDMGNIGVWRSPASALAWGVRGPRFESGYPDGDKQAHSPVGFFIGKDRRMQAVDIKLTSLASCAG